jgi:TorA maturation chaperone TorD
MEHESQSELISACESRQAIYSFLARVYGVELTKESLKELAEKRSLWLRLAEDPQVQGTEMAEGLRTLAEFSSKLEKLRAEDVLLELAAEYAGLFLGVRQMPPHPSESVYSSKDHLIMQKARDDVLKIYRDMGLEKVSKFTEPEDHIALELQFMSYLSGKTGEALKNKDHVAAERYLKVQRDFLNQHLGKWVPELVTDIKRGARREFYAAIAKITEGYVKNDEEVVLEMIDSLPPPTNYEAS